MMMFYLISENEKKHCILKNTMCITTVNVKSKENPPKKCISFFFNLNEERIRVCKTFFLETFLVSQKTIYNVHFNKDKTSGTPESD